MKTIRNLALILAAGALPLLCQTISIYDNMSTDGSYAYLSTTFQYSPPGSCTGMCATAYHTYSDTPQIFSPAGNANTCSFYTTGPASSSQDLGCEVAVPLDQPGNYQGDDNPYADCTVIGVFMDAKIPNFLNITWVKTAARVDPNNPFTTHWYDPWVTWVNFIPDTNGAGCPGQCSGSFSLPNGGSTIDVCICSQTVNTLFLQCVSYVSGNGICGAQACGVVTSSGVCAPCKSAFCLNN